MNKERAILFSTFTTGIAFMICVVGALCAPNTLECTTDADCMGSYTCSTTTHYCSCVGTDFPDSPNRPYRCDPNQLSAPLSGWVVALIFFLVFWVFLHVEFDHRDKITERLTKLEKWAMSYSSLVPGMVKTPFIPMAIAVDEMKKE